MDLSIGRIVKAHGTTGECVIEIRTDDPDQRFCPGTLVHAQSPTGQLSCYRIATMRPHSGRLLVRFEEINSRTDAEQLRGTVLTINTQDLPAIEEDDTYYDYQLEGLQVRTYEGMEIGFVNEILHTGAGELLSVISSQGRELLIPFVSAIVPKVAIQEGFIEINPPEGLLEL